MDDEELWELLQGYLEPRGEPNPEMESVRIEWEREDPDFGARHIREKHGLTETEVEQVLLEIPPFVEAKKHSEQPDRTIFWGATRTDKGIFVVCEDFEVEGQRVLQPITAFVPEEGEAYWNRL